MHLAATQLDGSRGDGVPPSRSALWGQAAVLRPLQWSEVRLMNACMHRLVDECMNYWMNSWVGKWMNFGGMDK